MSSAPWRRSCTRSRATRGASFRSTRSAFCWPRSATRTAAFRSVLIAGTNGKGSTAATLASILTASGLRTGLYTSPHLTRPNERIRLDGVEIADDAFAGSIFASTTPRRSWCAEGKLAQLPSFFETLTAMAFLHFAEAGVEIAVLEVGMGGRLDATNIVDPLLSVITDISLDHTEWLGSTIAAITREKAGILRRGGTLVTLPQHPEANQVLGEVATELGVRGVSAAPYMPSIGRAPACAPTRWRFWAKPSKWRRLCAARISIATWRWPLPRPLNWLPATAFPSLPRPSLRAFARPSGRAVWNASQAAAWTGFSTWRITPPGPGHCAPGLRDALDDAHPRTLIFSCLRDKPVAEMAQILFPLFDQVIFAPIHSARATPITDLLAAAEATGTPAEAAESVSQALELAQARQSGGVVVVSGSVYLVGDARSLLLAQARQPVGAQP